MRIGFLGPAQGDLELLERSASFLLRERVARVVYLSHDGALDQCVVAWAARLVGDDPTDDGAWSRAAEVAISGASDDLDAFVASERQRLRLRALVSLPEGSPCSLETLGDLTILMTHDAGPLSEEDLSHAALIVDGASADPTLELRGNRWWLAPGHLGLHGGLAVIDTHAEVPTVVVYDGEQREVLRGEVTFPQAPKQPHP
ncbi:MAG TPA: hypothetical protein VF316_03300 [Polyangiaceae bacterium]